MRPKETKQTVYISRAHAHRERILGGGGGGGGGVGFRINSVNPNPNLSRKKSSVDINRIDQKAQTRGLWRGDTWPGFGLTVTGSDSCASNNTHTQVQRDARLALSQFNSTRSAGAELRVDPTI